MNIEKAILEQNYTDFVDFIEQQDNKPFNSFKKSKYIDWQEGYKYNVFDEAKDILLNKIWKPSDIGSGKIQENVSRAILPNVYHYNQKINNNLIDWRKKDSFKKMGNSKALEQSLFDFYKSKIKDSDCFESFLSIGLSYQLIAYLFFIKDRKRFMPISQERFDSIFERLEIKTFKTSGNASWENYNSYLNLIKETKHFLNTKVNDVTLLDAHSFLWILGNFESKAIPLENKADKEIVDVNPSSKTQSRKPELAAALEKTSGEGSYLYPDEHILETDKVLYEGLRKLVTVNAYERSAEARKLCIEHFKPVCAVCALNFQEKYGEIGAGFIHVHHLKQIHENGSTYKVNPMTDLIPVCPNCHAMLHQKNPPYTIKEMKQIIGVE